MARSKSTEPAFRRFMESALTSLPDGERMQIAAEIDREELDVILEAAHTGHLYDLDDSSLLWYLAMLLGRRQLTLQLEGSIVSELRQRAYKRRIGVA